MKTIKHLLLFMIALTWLLSACTMEKRVYMPGYSISWKQSRHKTDRESFAKNNANYNDGTESPNSIEKTKAIEQQTSSIGSIAADCNDKINVPAHDPIIPLPGAEKELNNNF